MPHRLFWLILIGCFRAVPTLLAQEVLAPQVGLLIGKVVGADGEPVAMALVRVPGTNHQTRTDVRGQFRIPDVPVGITQLVIETGYYPAQGAEVIVRAGTGLAATVRLHENVPRLPEIVVAAVAGRPPEYFGEHKYDAFFRRRALGFGTFRTRAEIERLGAIDIPSALRGIAGVRASMEVAPSGAPFVSMRLARCPRNPPDLAVYIDGHKLLFKSALTDTRTSGSELTASSMASSGIHSTPATYSCPSCERLAEIFQMVPIFSIELIEFYHGVAQIPSDLDRDVCAAIVLWTRSGPRNPPPLPMR